MVKYFEELETNNFYLDLIDYNYIPTKRNRNACIPISVFEKYKELFNDIDYLYYIFEKLDRESVSEKLFQNANNSFFSLPEFDLKMFIELNEQLKFIAVKQKKEIMNYGDMVDVLDFYMNVIFILKKIEKEKEKEKENQYDALKNKLFDIRNEIDNYSDLLYDENEKRLVVDLCDGLFITPYNDLYNTLNLDGRGHKEATLFYSFENFRNYINSNIFLSKVNPFYMEKYKRFKKRDFVTLDEFMYYTNLRYWPYNIQKDSNGNLKFYDVNVFKVVLGIISAKTGLYKFFNELTEFTDNPIYEFEKLIDITKPNICEIDFNISDILVRCAGFHKIGVCNQKIIATSSINFCSDFFEYLKRGWDVRYIPPIIINKEKRTLEVLDSIIIDRYIEQKKENYEKNKQLGYGRIF